MPARIPEVLYDEPKDMSQLTRRLSCATRVGVSGPFSFDCDRPLYIDWCRCNVRYLRKRGIIAFVVIHSDETCCVWRSIWDERELRSWYQEFVRENPEISNPWWSD